MAHNQHQSAELSKILALLGIVALLLGGFTHNRTPIAQAATIVTVTPNSPNGWIFADDGDSGGSGAFVIGPDNPPLGTGSARLLVDANQAKILFNTNFNGTRLDTITKLSYSSYRSSSDAANVLAISLQFNIDYNLNDSNTNWQGRLVYEPYLSGASVPQNSWQSWDALAGKWWFSDPQGTTAQFCPHNAPCGWNYITTNWPDIGISVPWGAVLFKAGTWNQTFDGNIDAFTIATAAGETSYNFEYEAEVACTSDCYVNAFFGDDSYGGATAERAKKTIQAAVNQVSANGTVHVAPGIYGEAVSITKNGITLDGAGAGSNFLQHTIIKGPLAGQAGISLPNSNTTGITIKKLRVEGFTNGGICSAGANNNGLTIDSVQVVGNTAGNCLGGIYINGPVSDVTINNVLADNNTTRGIVIWNGFKKNITITNNTVTNNNCCGIELQDGTASGVTITGNKITNNADNGIGVIGLMAGAGPNLIANNTLTDNGRFGIEVKLPNGTGTESGDGSIVVRNNTVTLNTPIETLKPGEIRDLGGIVVIRRGYVLGNNNANIPTGVVVKNNTVSGYKQTNTNSSSDGFGIVVEGYKMHVYGNIVSDNDIGIQRQAGHTPYTADAAVDGDQSNLVDNYFGRGNSPHTCAMIGENVLTNNAVNTRDVTPLCDIADSLKFSTQPGNGEVGSALSTQPAVTVLGQDGEPFASFTGPVTLALGNNPSSGTLNGTLTVNAVNGVATFSGLSVDKVGIGYTLVASASGLTSATSTAFDITSGPATQLKYSTQPGGTQLGSALNPQPVVQVLDAQGNLVTSYSGPISIAIGANPSGGTLGGTLTVNAVNGVVTFSGLSVDKVGTGYTLVASASGLTAATSTAFDISALPATQLKYSRQPGSAVVSGLLNPQPVVQVLDTQGNLVTSYSGPISIAIGANPSGGTLNGTLTVNAVNGVATFTNLSIDQPGLDYTLVATASGLSSSTSLSFDITQELAAQKKFYMPIVMR